MRTGGIAPQLLNLFTNVFVLWKDLWEGSVGVFKIGSDFHHQLENIKGRNSWETWV
jgi:hypothetical protein